MDISPTLAKLVAVTIAVVALVATSFVADPAAQNALFTLAGALGGWQFVPRTGDVARTGVHVDDL